MPNNGTATNGAASDKKVDWIDFISFAIGCFFVYALTKLGFFDHITDSLWGGVKFGLGILGLVVLVKVVNWAPKWIELALGILIGLGLFYVLSKTDGGTNVGNLSELRTPGCIVGLVMCLIFNVSHNRPFQRLFKRKNKAKKTTTRKGLSGRFKNLRESVGSKIGGNNGGPTPAEYASGKHDKVTGGS